MRRLLFLAGALVLVAAACGGDDGAATPTTAATTTTAAATTTTTAATTTTTAATTTTTAEATTTTSAPTPGVGVIVIDIVDFESGFFILRNAGAGDYDLSGHFVCNRPSYQALPALVLAAGETVEVPTTGLGINGGSGELAVYTSSSFGNSDDIIRYVQWGNAGHGRASFAIAAGIWVEDDFVDNGGANIASIGDDPVSSADWTAE